MKKHLFHVLAGFFFVTFAHAQWEPIGTGYWTNLLHLGADFDNDYLYALNSNANAADQLADHGTQINQWPYAGLTYENLEGPTSGNYTNLTWTLLSIDAANGRWTPTSDRNNYVKYWHAYLWVPGDAALDATLRFCCDDDIRVWCNSILVATSSTSSSEKTAATTLLPGLSNITIKLREGSGNDYMSIRMTDSGGNALPGVLFAPSTPGYLHPPTFLSATHTNLTLSGSFSATTNAPFTLTAVCDTTDHSTNLDDWLTAGALVRTFPDITAIPPDITFTHLTPDTTYTIRYFVDGLAGATHSDHLTATTYDSAPIITALPPADIQALDATAAGTLIFPGANTSTAHVTLHWGPAHDPAHTNTLSLGPLPPGPFTAPLSPLDYTTAYRYTFSASNAAATAWAPQSISFTSLGQPILGQPFADTDTPTVLALTLPVIESGPVPATVTCLFGPDPGDLSTVTNWFNVGHDTNLTHTVSQLPLGDTFYYAFVIHSEVDASQSWTVHTATNSVTTAGFCTWTGLGANTLWHNPDNWDYGVPGPLAPALINSAADITTAADIVLGELRVNGPNPVALHLGAHTLTTANAYIGYDAGYAAFSLLSGTIDTTAGDFITGYNTAYNHTYLASGTTLLTSGLYLGSRINACRSNHLTATNAAITAATVVVAERYNNNSATGINELTLLQGSRLTSSGIGLGQTSNLSDSGITGRLIVDHSTVTNTGNFRLQNFGTAHGVTLRHSSLHQTGTLVIGHRAHGCFFEVLDDSTVHITGAVDFYTSGDNTGNTGHLIISNSVMTIGGLLRVGYKNTGRNHTFLVHQDPGHTAALHVGGDLIVGEAAPDNVLIVNNATLTANAIRTATNTSENNKYMAYSINNQVRVLGTASRLNLQFINLRNQALLSFSLDDTPQPDDAPLITATGAITFEDTTTFLLDVGDFAGRVTLLQAGTTLTPLTESDFTIISKPGRNIKLLLDDPETPTRLTLHVAPEATLFIFK